ncbi:MAG: peptidase domain-containing ABC transporter [Rhodocyclaceae bacterium]|nr:peptidase domain-containing ABC transporter [Rhodocyclaceae bacterium]
MKQNRIQDLLDFTGRQKTPVILQTEAAECGVACLAMVASYFGFKTDLATLRRRFSVSIKGATLAHLIAFAGDLKLTSRALRLDPEEMAQLKLPAILHWELSHFVVLTEVKSSGIVIHDPARGLRECNWAEVGNAFTGIALELRPAEGFEKKDERREIRVFSLLGKVVGLKRALIQVLLLSICLEVFTLVSPFFMQLVVDQAIASADTNLLTVLAVGFFLLMLIQLAVSTFRSWLIVYLSTSLNLQVSSNLFAHLLKLPMEYFEKRHLGDITSRFGSMGTIQSFITSSFIQVVLDGMMVMATLTMMLLYAPQLTLVVLAAVVLYTLLRIVMYAPLRRANEEQIVHAAKQQSHFLESLRGVQSIKLFGKRDIRLSAWQNLAVDNFNRGIAIQKMNLGFGAANSILFGAENILIVWLGAHMILEGGFSVGMLYAFVSYKGNFTGRISALVDLAIQYKMLSLHTERVADITLHTADDEVGRSLTQLVDVAATAPSIDVRNLHFTYSDVEQPVLNGVTFAVDPGECVAIVGPSGCGKTTLLKIMVGLLTAKKGGILIDRIPVGRLGLARYREIIGVVTQDDQLFAGSIEDNISFFEEVSSQGWVEQCARYAAIHEDIVRMPMGYATLVGDMGTSLSGGQKQRILLARALYKKPRILFLDEATSHLDTTGERLVNAAIKALGVTTIIVAHRPETIAMADRVIDLGRLNILGSANPARLEHH